MITVRANIEKNFLNTKHKILKIFSFISFYYADDYVILILLLFLSYSSKKNLSKRYLISLEKHQTHKIYS